ncbi:MAG TPA: hypothetical protein VLO11_10385 [Luteolibacter sp.]|nr:hypothetical protein [Luteolibacter sp.]
MKPRFIKLLIVAIPVLLLAACAANKGTVHRPVSRPSDKPIAILFVGNSYSFDVPKELKRLAARNGHRVRVGQVTNGGWTLEQHTRNEETLRAIREGGWDIVVLQEQSRIPSRPIKRVLAMFPAVRELAEIARSHGAEPVLYQTWGYRDGDSYRSGDDFHAMVARVREGYHAAAAHAGGLRVIPAGDAWEREMSAGRGAMLFQDDGSHPTREGNRRTASVFYRELLASDPAGDDISQTLASTSPGSSESP